MRPPGSKYITVGKLAQTLSGSLLCAKAVLALETNPRLCIRTLRFLRGCRTPGTEPSPEAPQTCPSGEALAVCQTAPS